MQKQLLTIAIVGIIIIGAVTFGGYYLGKIIQKPVASPAASEAPLTTEPSATPTPTPTPAVTPSLLPTAPPRTGTNSTQQVKGVATAKRTTPITATTGPSVSKEISIRFVGVPGQVKSDQSFVVGWFVDGPVGMLGDNTRLSTDMNVSNGSGSSSSTSTAQSFGTFQIPQKFQANVNFSGTSGSINLKATAEVGGKTYTATQTVQLTD